MKGEREGPVMLMCHKPGIMIISLTVPEIQTEKKEEVKRALQRNVHVFICCHPLLATGPLGKYQQLPDIIYGPVLYPTGTVRPERNFKGKATNSEVSPTEFPFATCLLKTFWFCDKMLVLKFPPKYFLERKMLDICKWLLKVQSAMSRS